MLRPAFLPCAYEKPAIDPIVTELNVTLPKDTAVVRTRGITFYHLSWSSFRLLF